MSSLIEKHATHAQKEHGYDLADYLIEQQTEINRANNYIDSYNAKLENVLHDENLTEQVNTILDEQKAILMESGNLPDWQAESICTAPENVRRAVWSVTL